MLGIEAQARKALHAYFAPREEARWLERVRVVLGDGRVAVPHEHRFEVMPDGGYPPDWPVWDSVAELSRNKLLQREDGKPPHPEAYQLAALSNFTPLLLLAWGVGSGKTTIGDFRLTELALCNPGGRTLIVGPSNKALWLNTILVNGKQVPKFEAYLPAWAIRRQVRKSIEGQFGRTTNHGFYEFDWKNGHRTAVLTVDYRSRADLRTQGPDVCGIWFEEASTIARGAIKTVMERFRDKSGLLHQAIFTTSLDKAGLLEELFINDQNQDRSMFDVIRAATTEATFRGPEYLSMLQKILTPEEYQRKVLAEIVVYSGLVYGKQKSRDSEGKLQERPPYLDADIKHPCWLDYQYDASKPVYVGFDPGDRRAALVFAQPREYLGLLGLVVFREIVMGDTSTEQIGALLRDMIEGANGQPKYNIAGIYTDYSTKAEGDRKTLKKFIQGGIVKAAVQMGQERFWDVPSGVSLVKQQCCDYNGARRLWISTEIHKNDFGYDMFGLRQGFSNYRYQEWKEGRPISDNPVKDGKEHVMDALRYLVLGRCTPRASVSEARR